MIGRRQSDYVEMLLHHSVTIYLLFGSYFINIWECGAIIALLHDITDIPAHFAKAFGQTKLDIVTIPIFLFMMVIWFYCRNMMLPYCIYHVWTQGLAYNTFDRYVFPERGVTMPIYCYLLSCLVMLHYYWFYLFCSMLTKFVSTGKSEDVSNVITTQK
jgi:sphingoid base N-palmitoyltransferase